MLNVIIFNTQEDREMIIDHELDELIYDDTINDAEGYLIMIGDTFLELLSLTDDYCKNDE